VATIDPLSIPWDGWHPAEADRLLETVEVPRSVAAGRAAHQEKNAAVLAAVPPPPSRMSGRGWRMRSASPTPATRG
jgi:hypothetical protein